MTVRFTGILSTLTAACVALAAGQQSPAPVDDAALAKVEARRGDWLQYGRDYYEQRFSPLDQINDTNVSKLGLAWYADIDTERGQESTPVVVDGVMYLTTARSIFGS